MSLLARLHLPSTCSVSGVLIAPERPAQLPEEILFFAGGHPLPTLESFAGAEAARALIEAASTDSASLPTFCFFLISGGASAMMELPLDRAISLEDTVAFHRALVHSGASIAEINCVRKHFSAVKGGRMGLLAKTIPSLTLLVSDVPGGQLDALASGPTLPDPSSCAMCLEILARHGLMAQFPPSVQRFFASSELPETPKPGDFPVHVLTLLSSDDLAEAARRNAESLGFHTVLDHSCDDWDFRPAAVYLLARFRDLRLQSKRVCLISAGEVTVQVSPCGGMGGRNQHFALYAATLLEASDRPAVVLSAGSDGVDGNSSCAGAVLEYDLLQSAGKGAAQDALARFDSSPLLEAMGATIHTGPTGNNLRDLRLFLSD